MTTRKQRLANRKNAKRSRGPKSASGKLRSRQNAIKHRLTARNVIIGEEDPKEYAQLLENIRKQYAPLTPDKAELVKQLVDLAWGQRRFPVFMAALIEASRDKVRKATFLNSLGIVGLGGRALTVREEIGVALATDSHLLEGLAKLTRYQTTSMNSFMRVLRQLRELQEQEESIGIDVTAKNLKEGRQPRRVMIDATPNAESSDGGQTEAIVIDTTATDEPDEDSQTRGMAITMTASKEPADGS